MEIFVLVVCVSVLKLVFCKAIINHPDALKFPSKFLIRYCLIFLKIWLCVYLNCSFNKVTVNLVAMLKWYCIISVCYLVKWRRPKTIRRLAFGIFFWRFSLSLFLSSQCFFLRLCHRPWRNIDERVQLIIECNIVVSSHRRCSVKKGASKNFANFPMKHLCWSLFLIKLQV